MALIKCPECGGQVSDAAKACPHCGYQLTDPQPQVQQTREVMRRSELSDPKLVAPVLVIGVIIILIGAYLVLNAPTTGIFVLLVGAAVILVAYATKQRTGHCPYCDVEISIPEKAQICRCPGCRKTSKVVGKYLETIE